MRAPALLLPLLLACGDKTDDTGSAAVTDDTGAPRDYGTTQLTDGGTWSVSYLPDPDPIPPSDDFTLTVEVAAAEAPGTPLADLDAVVVDATMPGHGHGMNVTPVTEDDGSGTWTAFPLKFHMTGEWQITVEVTEEGVTETAVFWVDCCEVPS